MSSSVDQGQEHWLDIYLTQNGRDGLLSFLEIGCSGGLRLQKATARGAQCFAVESDMRQREAARQLCPDAYIVSVIDDIPPHAFDLILLAPVDDAGSLQTCLYTLAAKDAFRPTTTLVVMARNAAKANEAAAVLTLLRFGKVETAETGPYRAEGHGSDFALFMQERYVPGTWSEIAAYEHLPRYQLACGMAQGARVLDFGCGSGYGTAALARVAACVVGLDISEDALIYARTIHHAANLEFVRDAAFGASLPSHYFDLIICFEVIEHIDAQSQDELLSALGRLLAPNGHLLISTPNPATTSLYGNNAYHLCELGRDEFAEKLRRHFSDLAMLDQFVVTSIIFQPEAGPKWARLHDLAGEDGGSQVAPAIFVAICSMEAVGELSAVAYLDRTRDFVSNRIQGLHWRNQQLVELYDLQQARQEISRLNLSMQQAVAQLRGTKAELDTVLADRAALQGTHAATEVALEQMNLSMQQAIAELRGTKAELDAVLADRAALQATHAATEVALEQSRREIGRVARERGEFHDLTEALTVALADMEMRATAEIAEVQARAETDLAQAQAQLAEVETRSVTDLAQAQTALADQHLQAVALAHELQTLAAKLMLIERSTSWRAAKRVMPLLRVLRPVLRPPSAVLWRMLSRLRRGAVWPSRPTSERQPFLSSSATHPELESRLPPRDLSIETSFDPVWNPFRRKYILRCDPSFASTPQSQRLGRPYVVLPLVEIDLSIRRPKLLHVIPNVHVGGSTQLVIDLVQRLCAELDHEVLTSSLWQEESHNGLTSHLVSDSDPTAIGEVIDRVSPDLIHFHYWGLTDDPWYNAVLVSIEGRNIPTIQNVNTPVKPLLHDIFQHYVFVSAYVRREFGGGIPAGVAVSVIHPGIEIQRFETIDPAADREDAIGMVYRLEEDKLTETAIDVFIEIVRRRPRTKVYIIGGGRFLEPYIARTEAANVRANFRFTGYVPYASLPGWYDKFSVFVAPVWKESFGQVAPFAMAKRQAVVGFKVGALSEILGSEETLGADVAETAAIAIALLNDRKRLRQIGDHNATRAREMFAVDKMVERYRSVYATLIELPRSRRLP